MTIAETYGSKLVEMVAVVFDQKIHGVRFTDDFRQYGEIIAIGMTVKLTARHGLVGHDDGASKNIESRFVRVGVFDDAVPGDAEILDQSGLEGGIVACVRQDGMPQIGKCVGKGRQYVCHVVMPCPIELPIPIQNDRAVVKDGLGAERKVDAGECIEIAGRHRDDMALMAYPLPQPVLFGRGVGNDRAVLEVGPGLQTGAGLRTAFSQGLKQGVVKVCEN